MSSKDTNSFMLNLVNEVCGRGSMSHKDNEVNPQEEGRQVNPGEQKTGRKSDTASSKDDAADTVQSQVTSSASASAKGAASDPALENDAVPTAEGSERQTSTAWDFFMSHCRGFDSSDTGVSVRIDRKVKKRLDLAKARMSESVSVKGMVSAIVMHFLMEHDAMFDQEEIP